ncbi:MAG: 2,3-bisphosphoglycerate-dependent phosphoglycerate mutase, partial [Alphaproteobacteria bacterium]|nr:2,3-bisphosphoglycerate-dependent phosphoglycerate mutase [Alphaproteobacteria bacterium]
MRREVWVRKPELVEMREVLASPDYDIPAVKNEQIELFRALLTDFDRIDMENAWTKLRQTYEQEMDQRIYQEKARDGALRDSLLKCFDDFPDRLSEFLALLCYFTLPKLSISFLMKFTHNKGTNDDERNRKIPYWENEIAPSLRAGARVLIAAHGNSLRGLVKHLEDISDHDIAGLEIPTGVPLLYDLDRGLRPLRRPTLAIGE